MTLERAPEQKPNYTKQFDLLEELFDSVEEEVAPSSMGDRTHRAMGRARRAIEEKQHKGVA